VSSSHLPWKTRVVAIEIVDLDSENVTSEFSTKVMKNGIRNYSNTDD
jgi:hypothetical protein